MAGMCRKGNYTYNYLAWLGSVKKELMKDTKRRIKTHNLKRDTDKFMARKEKKDEKTNNSLQNTI